MCGIVGYVGLEKISHSILISGLRALEYRGYDSAGIALAQNNSVHIIKSKGNVAALQDKLHKSHLTSSNIGIAHTRWATHGIPSETNSHPHRMGSITLVHNGIIENYIELKNMLISKGYQFQSDTDSEIAAGVIDYCFKRTKNHFKALQEAYPLFRGSFAFGIMFDDELDALYAMRKNSPLILATAKNQSFLASDISAVLSYTNRYLLLDHEEFARISFEGIIIKNAKDEFIHKEIKEALISSDDISKNGYDHFMLKEIHEQSDVIRKTIAHFIQDDLSNLMQSMPDLSKYNQIQIAACGSAMYAGMIAKSIIESKARIMVSCQPASEYRYASPIFDQQTLVILISQSGETADTIAALQLAKEHNIDTLAIVNVASSTIAREATYVLPTLAGVEISVATTKAYCAQVAVLSLIACHLSLLHNKISDEEKDQLLSELKYLPIQMEELIQKKEYKRLAEKIYEKDHLFFIGRGLDYALSLEGSLKLKEISYIHSEAYAAGELKHGTISLIEEGTPVIALASDEKLYEKTISNIKEVKARGAYVILIASDDLKITKDYYDDIILIPKVNHLIQGILSVIPLQLLAYETARIKGCEIDQPRNLAKSVTVE